ncbi:glycine cleavage system protein GcvH [Desulforamulus hydrothermalis]|uniref:Glycine cleavage system H protein n=1 Tax=Desulforamulus hydrothermalis Lam5 = DSM 18033 TaxID=1121428 RepID=K8E007_9FIRM|nr:glycine cleavage system protein GcvH [Desulforamulus hydrothermalis]CCO08772.1 Glycine cleavage system H protein [Desulforamulus hydrothermalis Lam5 = DSM 18033]SHG71109.1 glycine cleavage system H protein [Desulforamulus hydrothermalis Lam5 = DSM 18033]
MKVPVDLKYSREHEWVRVDGNRVTVGITDYAQESMGDIVFVELPAIGDAVVAEEPFGVVESVKTASDLYAPVSGQVVEINNQPLDEPAVINQEPYGRGWLIVVEMSDPAQLENLLSPEEYRAMVEEQA